MKIQLHYLSSFLIIVLLSSCVSVPQKDEFNLYGQWKSNKGQGIGFMVDKNAPYTIQFDKDKFLVLGKEIEVKYQFHPKFIIVDQLAPKKKWKIKIIDNNTIQLNYPGIGLRRFNKVIK